MISTWTGKPSSFRPWARSTRYRFQTSDASYDPPPLGRLALREIGDDATASVDLPFRVSFFGSAYRQLFVNSDGNLTFNAGDATVTDRSLGG
jgi:hypothetical protein